MVKKSVFLEHFCKNMNSSHTKHLMAFAEYEYVREEFKLGDCVNICNRRSILEVWGKKIADLQIIPIP